MRRRFVYLLTTLAAFLATLAMDAFASPKSNDFGLRDGETASDDVDTEIDGYQNIEPKAGASGLGEHGSPPEPWHPRPSATFQPAWIGKHPDAPEWTEHTREAIETYGSSATSIIEAINDFRREISGAPFSTQKTI